MSKTTARTFLAAAVLLAVTAMIYIYGYRVIENQMAAAREAEPQLAMSDNYHMYFRELDKWERAAILTGLLAVAVSITGAILWEREMPSVAQQSSILGLNQQAAGRNVRRAAPQNVVAFMAPGPAESHTRLCEEDSLTPLERVIRGN